MACSDITVKVDPANASAPNSTAISSPTIFNYPVQPINDTGRQMALGAIVGTLVDALLGGDGAAGAAQAESEWKSMLDNYLKAKGQSEIDRVPGERAKLADFETDLKNQLADYRTKADEYYSKLAPLDTELDREFKEYMTKSHNEFDLSNTTCVDDALRAVCQYVTCGYTPDYTGIASRARADAEIAERTSLDEACRLSNRYNTHVGDYRARQSRLQMHTTALLATNKGREDERQFMWKTNQDMRFALVDKMEGIRLGRRELSYKYDALAIKTMEQRWAEFAQEHLKLESAGTAIGENRWTAYNESAFKSFREGGEMLAAAAQAYQFLAASIRATAKQSGGGAGLGALLPALGTVLTVFNGGCGSVLGGFFSRPQECCPAATPTPTP
jgi:hypothetical protein